MKRRILEGGVYYSAKHDELVLVERTCMPMFGKPAKYNLFGRFLELIELYGLSANHEWVRIGKP